MKKGYKENLKLINQKIGPEKRQEFLDNVDYKGTLLPKGVLEEDMDRSVIDFIESDKGFSLVIDDRKVPVIFLSIERWGEFTKTWQFTDEYKNIEMPFITIIRNIDIQQGTNQAGLWNIAGNRTYTYIKVPTFDGARTGIDLYKIPQPTSVDMTYEVRLFTTKIRHLNKFNRIIQKAFQSRQCYVDVNGHPMPLHLETIGDESNIDDIDKRRFYVQLFELKLLGYILDESDFEVTPTINRMVTTVEIDDKISYGDKIQYDPIVNESSITLSYNFKPKSGSIFSYINQYDITVTQLTGIIGISRIIILVNDIGVFDGTILTNPLIFKANDKITIKVTKGTFSGGFFKLIGNTI